MGERGRGGEEGRGDGDQERVCVRWCCWIEKQGSTRAQVRMDDSDSRSIAPIARIARISIAHIRFAMVVCALHIRLAPAIRIAGCPHCLTPESLPS